MISQEMNDRLTRTGPDRACGQLLRRYWQPAALSDELMGERPVCRSMVLGQKLVLFRDEEGRLGALERHCAHRGADLSFGRREDGGLRCPFHGWLFDVSGRCLETPAEPDDRMCTKIRQRSYPVLERSGIIFVYLGDGEPPHLPDLDCFVAPDTHVFAFKGHIDCNWLQALEVGLDPAHASFLHRFFDDADTADSYGKQFRAASAGSDMPMTRVLREFPRPDIGVDATEFGLRITALRRIDERFTHVRVTNMLFPQAFVIPLSQEMTITQWHVPIDDYSCYWYAIFTGFREKLDKTLMREQRLELYQLPDYRPKVGRFNDYGFDPYEQAHQTYTGMGADINVHDQWAVESQGAIQDRTQEHPGRTDRAINAHRRLLLSAMVANEQGERPFMVLDRAEAAAIRGPHTVDGIGPSEGWQKFARTVDSERVRGAPWFDESDRAP
ncbi:aromatic ring-hydroxylating dioxygenase subunit alpha [Acetobacteraceae bacterium KSS8]|uniref:Aromatic ring-hydroxylating dioxygenase subunit alpha n=1 Tax=Endosaccharibacter trunci TaxID=2812733 RepID=A0ABT1WB49_9PROT|nr:aromatic ring-hydroxylating dioxygenase subunit alpha [Acetobacteraceae bacterium KSS8]